MFERLFTTLQAQERSDGNKRVITLDRQFRMHPALGRFISENFYEPYGEHVENGITDPAQFCARSDQVRRCRMRLDRCCRPQPGTSSAPEPASVARPRQE